MATQRVIITYADSSVFEENMNPDGLAEFLKSAEKNHIKLKEVRIHWYSNPITN